MGRRLERAMGTLLWLLTGNSTSVDGARWKLNPYFTFFPRLCPSPALSLRQVNRHCLPWGPRRRGKGHTNLLTFTFRKKDFTQLSRQGKNPKAPFPKRHSLQNSM